jgi:hypothetical protein
MNNFIFWDITPCSPLKVNRHFGGICHLNLQSRRWAKQETIVKAGENLPPWRWRRHIPPKRRLTFNGLHGVIFKKIQLFLTMKNVHTEHIEEDVCRNIRHTWPSRAFMRTTDGSEHSRNLTGIRTGYISNAGKTPHSSAISLLLGGAGVNVLSV